MGGFYGVYFARSFYLLEVSVFYRQRPDVFRLTGLLFLSLPFLHSTFLGVVRERAFVSFFAPLSPYLFSGVKRRAVVCFPKGSGDIFSVLKPSFVAAGEGKIFGHDVYTWRDPTAMPMFGAFGFPPGGGGAPPLMFHPPPTPPAVPGLKAVYKKHGKGKAPVSQLEKGVEKQLVQHQLLCMVCR